MSEERTRIEQRLHDLLNTRDEELEKARGRIEKLEGRLRGSETAWSMPRDIDDDFPDLPVPRLEMVWTRPDDREDWRLYTVEYRLVARHLLGELIAYPFGSTRVDGGSGKPPWEERRSGFLPIRDGAHIAHDSVHLGLPAFAIFDGRAERIDFSGYPHQTGEGTKHRVAQEGPQ